MVLRSSTYTEEQIAFALEQVELGVSVAECCRKMGVGEQTYYRRKKRYTDAGRAAFWAESAVEMAEQIEFRFVDGRTMP